MRQLANDGRLAVLVIATLAVTAMIVGLGVASGTCW